MELLRDFTKLGKEDVALAGGKSASLGEMTRAGIAIPPGFVILSIAFEKFLEETDLNVEIDSILDSVNHKEIHTVENASEKIKALILGAEMPKDIANEIQKFFKELNAKYVAVRSSATAEDSASAAWAGQLESYLNTTKETLLENVKKCWASLFTPRAIFYRFEKDLHKQKISVAVVVQKMVDSEKSGIAFSVHPVTQDRNQLIIEAGLGLGEAIVSGQITPDSYVVEKQPRRIVDKNVQPQSRGLYRAKNGGNEWRDISKEQGEKQVLSDKEILELSETILKIEKHYGFPCDIEWAFERGKFYIIQSRPITTLLEGRENSNIIWHAISSRGRNHAVFIIDTMVNAIVQRYDKGIYGVDLNFREYRQLDKKREVSERDYQEVVSKLIDFAKNNPVVLVKIPTISLSLIEILDKKIKRWEKQEVWREISSWHKIINEFFVLVSKIWSGAPGYSYIFLGDKVAPIFIEEITKSNQGLNIEEATLLLQPETKTEMTKLLTELEKLAKIPPKKLNQQELKSILSKYGHLGRYYFWGSGYNEKAIIDWIRKIRTEINSGKARTAAKKVKKVKLTPRQKILREAFQKYALMSNRADEVVNKGIEILQPMWLGIAKKFEIKYEHVANMRASEIIDSLVNNKLVVDKKELIRRTKDHLFWFHDGKIILDTKALYKKEMGVEKQKLPGSLLLLRGQNASVKQNITGVVKILNTPKDMPKLKQGEILVTSMTNPEFLPAMQKAAGFITDDGGLLCHAAIVARELSKPCIVGVKTATQILKDGQKVEMNTLLGEVRVLQ